MDGTNTESDSRRAVGPVQRTLPKLPYLDAPEPTPAPVAPAGPDVALILLRASALVAAVTAAFLFMAAMPISSEPPDSPPTSSELAAENQSPQVTVETPAPKPAQPPAGAPNLRVQVTATVDPVDPFAALRAAGGTWVKIVYTDDPTLNCGMKLGGKYGGCFSPKTPTTMYIWPGTDPRFEEYLLLHEYAHAVQWRDVGKLNECGADRQAVAWGADPALAYYLPHC